MSALITWLRARRPSKDAGASLLELTVGMTIMSVFMAIFTGAIVGMSRTANKVESVTTTAAQVNLAFLKLDKSIRYATAIATAGQSTTSGDWYVEFATATDAAEACTQLRVDIVGRQLQQRTWTVTGTGASLPTAWSALADGITNGSAAPGSADQPFSVPAAVATASSGFQRLAVTIVATNGTNSASTARSSISFTALNSNATAATNSGKCQQVGRP